MPPRAVSHTIAEIAAALGLPAWGDTTLRVTHAAAPQEAGPDALALASTPDYADKLSGTARAALVWEGADPEALGLSAAIFAPRPRFALAGLSAMMDAGPDIAPGIHPSAVIGEGAEIGDGAAIGPFVVIGAGARIGPGARIAPHVTIGAGARLGAGALLMDRVAFGARCSAGDRFIAQPGAVIGGDGFSYVTEQESAVESVRATLGDARGRQQQAHARIHSLGAVSIGDDVEIGANATIDRGTLADTVIGSGTKIDNLVQVAHNVIVGRDCLLCGQSGIAGSTVLGDRCVLGGQAGVVDHVKLGDDVIVAAATPVRTNQPSGRVLLGDPAQPMERGVATFKALRRLPRLARDVAEMRAQIGKHLSNRDGGD